MRSLVLIGHGSHLNGESAVAVYKYAELIRSKGLFDEVIEGYWKEEPSLRQVLRTTASNDVTVIPMFISEGYFTETVIPRELGLGHQGPVPKTGIVKSVAGKTVRYALPYGVHPSMTEVILARAREVFPELKEHGSETALVVLGHGTTRNENSKRVIIENAERLQATGLFAEVEALFLDQDPKVNTWPDVVKAPNVIVVPFFASEGWHTLETIPEDMGLTGEKTVFPDNPHGQQTVYYSKPVGTHSNVSDVVLQLVEEISEGNQKQPELDQSFKDAWNAFFKLANEDTRIGEISIKCKDGMYELRNALDEGRPSDDLRTFVTPEGVRDLTRLNDGGQHRPVHTLRNMPRGWRAMLSKDDLQRTMHYIYPAVIEESFACHSEKLRSTPWNITARRQTGIYSKVQKATPEQVEHVASEICSGCLKTRIWAGENLSQTFFKGVPGGIPCAEACTLLVAEIREEMSGTRGNNGHHHDH